LKLRHQPKEVVEQVVARVIWFAATDSTKTLAWRSTDNPINSVDVDLGLLNKFCACEFSNVCINVFVFREVLLESGFGLGIVIHGCGNLEACARCTESQPSHTAEQVNDRRHTFCSLRRFSVTREAQIRLYS